MKNFKAKLFGVSLFVLTLAASCNHDFDKVVPASPGLNTDIAYKTPKVLYIIADGARGVSVRDADIPNLKSLLPNAIYSWNGLADTTNTDATNWADMITGVKKEKHNVLTESFVGNNLAAYPPIFQRIKSVKPTLRIASFSASGVFKDKLTGGSDLAETFTTDEAVKTRMVDFLKADTASLVLGEFGGIEAAGKASGVFDNSNAAYKAAIGTFDTQLGAVISAIKNRATYAKENWMIIVSSNRGGPFAGAPNDRTVFSNTLVNTFTLIYNASFNQTFIAKPFVGNSYSGTAVRFLGDPEKGVARASAAASPNFNFGDTASFTISVKVKKHLNPSNISRGDYYYQWPGFMGKRGRDGQDPQTGWADAAGPGWDFCLFQNRWRFLVGGGVNFSGGGKEIAGLEFSGDTWHDLTAVVERKANGVKYIRVYTDGVKGIANQNGGSQATPFTGDFQCDGQPNFDNKSVLRLGYAPGEMDGNFGKIDVELKEFKIFKAALPDNIVTQYACDQSIDRSHPYFNYLIGYWPIDEGSGTTLLDKGPYAADMTLSQANPNGYRWTTFTGDLICSPSASNLGLLVPKNADIPTQILSWFSIARQAAWGLDGKVWISN